MIQNIQNKVKKLKRESLVLHFSYKDPNLALWKKVFIGLVIGYLFSPIDLIPDFIPIIGYFDDLLIVPIGIAISLRLIPQEILEESRKKVNEKELVNLPVGKKTAIVIILIWLIGLFSISIFFIRLFHLKINFLNL